MLIICAQCLEFQRRGEAITDGDMLKVGLDGQQWARLRLLLLENKVLVSTANNHYVLARDPSELTLWELNGLVDASVFNRPSERGSEILAQYPWSDRLVASIDAVGDRASEQFSLSLQDLFDAQASGRSSPDIAL